MIRALSLSVLLAAWASAQAPVTRQGLMAMKRAQLDELYKTLPAGPIPDGVSRGSGSLAPGEVPGALLEPLIKLFWRGKKFDAKNGKLTNVTLIGDRCEAAVYVGESWLDRRPAIIIDYTKTACPGVRSIRDEIRLAAPGLYFGYAFTHPARQGEEPGIMAVFALEFAR